MIQIRKSKERGHAEHGWLESYHSFSFADYFDPKQMGFRALRVINEDWIEGGQGFPLHGHRDMEIITYIIEGALEHRDTLGSAAQIRPGEVQRMTAGTGIRHSEYNALPDRRTHLLQIWILPDRQGHKPGYEQKDFSKEISKNNLVLVASPGGEGGSIHINQNAKVYVAKLKAGEALNHEIGAGRYLWVQAVRAEAICGGTRIESGDGVAISEESQLSLKAEQDSEFLIFDLP